MVDKPCMGMFDRIKCSYSLPGDPPEGIEFQTKDLDNCLDDYEITSEGRLVHHQWDWEETPEDDKPYPNATDWKAAFGCIRKVKDSHRVVDLDYHGDLKFYGDAHSGELRMINFQTGHDELHTGPGPEWFEYVARFTHGKLESVRRIERP